MQHIVCLTEKNSVSLFVGIVRKKTSTILTYFPYLSDTAKRDHQRYRRMF